MLAAAAAPRPAWADIAAWDAWAAAFLMPDGRVVDALQGGVSHSEGQGYGMILAAAAGDEPGFEAMRVWTENNLAVRQDPLLAWRWRTDDVDGARDYNNASDGDLFYAWALLRGARTWGRADLADRAAEIAAALIDICLAADPRGEGEFLMPGAERFDSAEGIIVNPSYWMPLAMHDLAAAFNLPRLAAAGEHGAAFLWDVAEAGPVPDWIEVTASGWRPSPLHDAISGYEAIRVPLWLVWSGRPAHPAVRRLPTDPRGTNAFPRTDLATGAVLESSRDPGYGAIVALAGCAASVALSAMPIFTAEQPYYPSTLHLLAMTAATEVGGCR